jgi:Tol biopolymer transport system component
MDTVGTLVDPSWRPDGSEIVVARSQVGLSEVLAVDPSSGNARTILEATNPEILSSPRVSPDGKAMLVEVVVAGEPSVRVVPAVGGQATTEVINAGGATWIDPDSFMFSREEEGGFGLYRYSLGKRETTRLRQSEGALSWLSAEPRPGGGFALLSGSSGIPSGLFVARKIDGPARTWLPPDKQIFGASWAPSGRSLVASIDGRLVRVTADGSDPVIPRIDRLWHPAFSPSADRLAVVRKSSTNDLVAVDPDGGGWSCLLCGVADSGWGSVDAGGVVAYRRYIAGSATLFLREPSGVEVAVTDPSEDASCPSVSPDGDRIAYLARVPESGTELRVVARSGGQPVTLATDVESSEYPSWSPDGRLLAFAAGSPIKVSIVPASGGEPRELTPNGGDYPQWSPSGQWIAYSVWTQDSDPDQGAWVVDVNSGETVKIGREPTRLAWSRDGRLLWQLRRAGDQIELWEAESGVWTWRRRSILDLGRPAASHLEHLPLTVNPSTGELVMNRRTSLASLVVFDDVDPARW